jgi:hypothetical protein
MNRSGTASIVLLALTLLTSACDTGLTPLNEPSGFSGVIRFTNWPPPDSVLELRLVAFKEFPRDSASILIALIQGRVVVYPPLGTAGFSKYADSSKTKLADSLRFEITTKGTSLEAIQYGYIALALRYGTNILTDWRPAGVYTTTPNSFDPAPVRVLLHKIIRNIDISVDFHNPPPKPWR